MFALLFFCLQSLAVDVGDVPDPRPHSHVADMADVLTPAAEVRIDEAISEIRAASGVQAAVVTVPSTNGTPKDFAVALGNRWGLGEAGLDNGLIILLAMEERRLEMEQGEGMEEVLPASWLQQMQQQAMVPLFKRGDFAGGLEAGVMAVHTRLKTGPGEGQTSGLGSEIPAMPPDLADLMEPDQPTSNSGSGESTLFTTFNLILGGLVSGFFVMLGAIARFFFWRRQSTCPTCSIKMRYLNEVEDDDHLTEGQQLEEQIGSRNYHVYICGQCQYSNVVPISRWFSGFSKCPGCFHKTLSSSSVTIVAATYDHGGEVEVTETCAHCSHNNVYTRYTAQLTRSDDDDDWGSSSSSSSSFSSSSGGGSFGGGGSGSSW